jgi:hypothetical protein
MATTNARALVSRRNGAKSRGSKTLLASAEGGLQDAPGAELVRDCNGPCTMETLLRYRGSAFAEPFRSLEALKRLQAEAGATQIPASSADALAAPSNLSGTERTREVAAEQ